MRIPRRADDLWSLSLKRTVKQAGNTPRILPALALLLLAIIVFAAVFAGVLSSHDPLSQDAELRLLPPGQGHPFGTDGLGRDVFSRVLHGARTSLAVGFLAVGIAGVAGTALGLSSAFAGGRYDLILQRLVDTLLGFPSLVMAIIVIVTLKPSWLSVASAISISFIPAVARISRAAALSVSGELYITAARINGARGFQILINHILPNSFSPVLAQLTGYFGAAMAAETTLSFLGLGTPPPYPSWGRMLQEGARQYFEVAPWTAIFPGLVLSIAVICFSIAGDKLRDLLDPKNTGI